MSIPNANTGKNPDPLYARELVRMTGLTQNEVAARLGISPRQLRKYLARPEEAASAKPIPYCEQFTLECLSQEQPTALCTNSGGQK